MFYNKRIVADYVQGNDIVDYELEQLENDYKFMIDVIKYTKDKKIYKLCSDEVKNNSEFIKFLVNFFRDDKRFVMGIVDDYLEKVPSDDIAARELLILITDIVGFDDGLGLTYGLKRNGFYELEKINISIVNKHSDVNFGKGFFLILDKYGSSKIIMDYFAKRFIDEIFYVHEVTFEQLIHEKYRDVNIIKRCGINNFIINYIGSFDELLANYVEANIELINEVKRDLVKVVDNWDNYLVNLNYNRCLVFYEEMFKIIDDYDCIFGYSYDEIANYVINKLGLVNLFNKYYYLEEERKFESIDTNDLSVVELRCLRDIVEMTRDLFGNDVIDKSNDAYSGFSKGKKKNKGEKRDF